MSYEDTILGTWKKHHLFSALVELTYQCNLDCYFCYNDLELRGQPLKFSDYERLFDEMRSLGCLHLTLSGGEPLAELALLIELLEEGRRRYPDARVSIQTNGDLLDAPTLDRLLATGLDHVGPRSHRPLPFVVGAGPKRRSGGGPDLHVTCSLSLNRHVNLYVFTDQNPVGFNLDHRLYSTRTGGSQSQDQQHSPRAGQQRRFRLPGQDRGQRRGCSDDDGDR